ncbi:MAG: hypothetical protein MUP66_00280 [Candidatus Nanohaloarchaeota archaeon QJJ-5]|nr:hypothetical protein [Candidatus Nanohaloarchaeota archaeon QJJ-5]
MELSITAEKQNPLLGRDEYELTIDHTGEVTPAGDDVRKNFAAQQDFDRNTVSVETIQTEYGNGISRAVLTVWDEPVHEPEDEEDTEDGQDETEDTQEEDDA